MKAFLVPVIRAASDTLSEIEVILRSEKKFEEFVQTHGWIGDEITSSEISLINAAINITSLIIDIKQKVGSVIAGNFESDQLIQDLENLVKNCYLAVDNINQISSNGFSIFPLDQSQFWNELAENLFPFYFARYIKQHNKVLYSILLLFGVIEYKKETPIGTGRISYVKTKVNWERIGDFISDPIETLTSLYGWDSSTGLNYNLLLQSLEEIFRNFNIGAKSIFISDQNYQNFISGNTTLSGTTIKQLDIPIFNSWENDENNYKSLTLEVVPIPANNSSTKIDGFALNPVVEGFLSLNLPINSSLFLVGEGYFASDNFLHAKILPGSLSLDLSNNFNSEITIKFVALPDLPYLIVGSRNRTRLEVHGVEVALRFINVTSDPELVVEFGKGSIVNTEYIEFAYEPSQGDGFIKKLLGKRPFTSRFGIGIRWSSKTGITFTGSGGFEIEIPLHDESNTDESTSLLRINTLRLGAGIGNGKFSIYGGADISFNLGFISGSITDIGAKLSLAKKNQNDPKGILNNLDFQLAFKFPKGIGLKIKAAAFEGGGFLYLDSDKGRYFGAVEIKVVKKFSLTAIGIVTTKNPDGTDGFSFLILINFTFSPSIPIGFGFSLSGVGGVAGVNRSLAPEPLRLGVKTGAINRLLFPEKVIENIQTIITDLEQIFPTERHRYTFGLFFLLGWGVPTPLIKIKLGIIISIPSPVILAIIGTVSIKLPTEDKTVLQLNVAFAGIIDFDKKYLTFDATIYDSKILTFGLYGDIAVRVFWGQHREILISVGGFHPAFNPPAYLLLPTKMDRLTISIFNEENLRLVLATYFALTSNTVQFGARLDFLFKISKFQIVGLFGLDVLFQFNPFKFRSDVYAMLAVLAGDQELLSISLQFMLEGPGPWHASGNAEFKVLGIKCKADFDKTWGPAPATVLPSVAVAPLVQTELEKEENWQAQLPPQKQLLVQIRPWATNSVVLHPLGDFTITQKIAPLGIRIERFGTQQPSDGGIYDITGVKIDNVTQTTISETDNFAPAQFRAMNDDQKLEAASFEYLRAGVRLKGPQSQNFYLDSFVTKNVVYDTIIIDSVHRLPHPNDPKVFAPIGRTLVNDFTQGGLVSENAIAKEKRMDLHQPIVKASLKQEGYKIVSNDSMQELSSIPGSNVANTNSGSLANALTLLEQLVQQQPGLVGKIQAVPVYA